MHQLGNDLKLLIDPSGVGESSWAEFDVVEEQNLNQSRNVGEIRNRASDFVKVLSGKTDAQIEVTATFPTTEDSQYSALRQAYLNKTDVGVFAATGPAATVGTEGLQADCKVTQFNLTGPLEDAVKVVMTLRPSAESTTEPSYAVVSS